MASKYVIGLDFGTDSVRAVIVDALSGKEEANEVALYKRWTAGLYCEPAQNQFRQHPLDYIEGLEASVKGALAKLPAGAAQGMVAIGIDTTGSTPVAVDRDGSPLSLNEELKDNPNALFIFS
ncbi:Ribulokinase [subsurface metagenome]